MSLEIIGLIIHPFINVAAFLVILSKITKIKHTRFFVAVCFGLEIIIPFIIAFLGHIFSFSSTIPSYTLSFFLPLFIVWYFCKIGRLFRWFKAGVPLWLEHFGRSIFVHIIHQHPAVCRDSSHRFLPACDRHIDSNTNVS